MLRIVQNLMAAGVPITLERVREIAGNSAIGRPHIGRALVEAGVVDSVGGEFGGGDVADDVADGAEDVGEGLDREAVDGDVLAKYESLGGPEGSDLGFPITSTADGPIAGSRFNAFAADDQPVIFASPDNGAFVVRGAMKAAWSKLDGGSGKLGAPVGDQRAALPFGAAFMRAAA